jgi:hypothetical protein
MTVAFVISNAEDNVVRALSSEDTPFMNGGLFTFTRAQLPAFVNALAEYAEGHETSSEEFRATARLLERLGTWIGRNQPEPTPVATAPSPSLPHAQSVGRSRSRRQSPT